MHFWGCENDSLGCPDGESALFKFKIIRVNRDKNNFMGVNDQNTPIARTKTPNYLSCYTESIYI